MWSIIPQSSGMNIILVSLAVILFISSAFFVGGGEGVIGFMWLKCLLKSCFCCFIVSHHIFRCGFIFLFICLGFNELLKFMVWKILICYLFLYCHWPFFVSFPSRTPIRCWVLLLSHLCLFTFSIIFHLFMSLCCILDPFPFSSSLDISKYFQSSISWNIVNFLILYLPINSVWLYFVISASSYSWFCFHVCVFPVSCPFLFELCVNFLRVKVGSCWGNFH